MKATLRFRIAKTFCYDIQDTPDCRDLQLLAHPELYSRSAFAVECCSSPPLTFLLQNRKSDRAEIQWEALGQHGDSELLKSLRSDIKDGRIGSHHETLQTTSKQNAKLN